MKAMIDTSVLIAGLPAEIIGEIENYCSSMICRAELARGLYAYEADPAKRRQAATRRELLRLLDAIPGFWIDFDRSASDGYGRLTAVPSTAIRHKDALIAGHCVSRQLPLVTGDKGFTRFSDLEFTLVGEPEPRA